MSIGLDKWEHAVLSAFVVFFAALHLPLWAIAATVLVLGGLKEVVWDGLLGKGDPDIWDFVADIVGVVVGTGAAALFARLFLVALLVAGSVAAAPNYTVSTGGLSTTGTSVVLNVLGYAGASLNLTPGFKGTIKVQTASDNVGAASSLWADEAVAGPIIVGATTTQYSATFPIPAGATHVQAIVSSWTTGTTTAYLRATPTAGPARATAYAQMVSTSTSVMIPIDPNAWATAKISIPVSSTSQNFAVDLSTDSVTWIPSGSVSGSPFIVRTDAASPSSSIAASDASPWNPGVSSTPTYELSLYGIGSYVRVRALSATGTNFVQLSPGRSRIAGSRDASIMTQSACSGVTATTQCLGLPGAGLSYYLDNVMLSSTGTQTFILVSSPVSGNNCATSPSTLMGPIYITAGGGGPMPLPTPMKVPANNVVCCNLATANASTCSFTARIGL